MVHCLRCGAANPDESKLCQECGAVLPASGGGVRCPMCSHINPEGRETCERCNARLIPLVAPSPSPGIPDLMSDDLLPERPSASQGVEPSGAPSATSDELDEGIPDWLQRMRQDALSEGLPPADRPEPEAEPVDSPDWLSRLGPVPEDIPPTEARRAIPTPPAQAEVPDWLADLMPAEDAPIEEASAAEPAAESEVPDWLADLMPAEDESPEEVPTTEPVPKAEVPDWLAELAPVEEAPIEEAPAAEGEMPGWLAELAPAEEAAVEEEPAAEAEVPDWLAELAPAEEAPIEEEPAAEGEVPDWLAELAPAEEAAVEEEPAAEAEVPDWLVALAAAQEASVEEELTPTPSPDLGVADRLSAMTPVEEQPVAPQPADVGVPDWLAQMVAPDETEAIVPPRVESEALGLGEEAPAEEEALILAAPEVEVPDWLVTEVPPGPGKEALVSETGPMPEESGLVQAEIPAWLQAMRPDTVPAPVDREEEREVESSGLLAGIAGVVPPASIVTAFPSVTAKPEGISAEATMARARLWQELIARSAQPSLRELPRTGEVKARYRVERWLVYAIVFLAVILPFAVGVDLSGFFNLGQSLTTDTGAAVELINGLDLQDTPVLVAFDYGPAYMGELGLQAAPLLRHLAQRQARIIAISLTPEGAGLAQQVIDDVLTEQGYQVGQNYVNVGYLPGEAVGIRSLRFLPPYFQARAFDGTELQDALVFDNGESLALGDMSLIVVLTSDADNMRWWVEQTTALEREFEMDLPLVAGVSAAIEALIRPYYDMESRQIDGLVVGLAGAADYERALDWLDGPANVRLDGLLLGQMAVLVLVVIGMLFYGLLRRGQGDA